MLTEEQYNNILEKNWFYVIYPDGQVITNLQISSSSRLDVIPGSFNPLHAGHKRIYHMSYQGPNKFFELSLTRVGKPSLSLEEVNKRIKQFEWYAPVIVTNCAKFKDKLALFTNEFMPVVFHIGWDSCQRLLEQDGKDAVAKMKCTFRVYDRGIDGAMRSLDQLDAPSNMTRTPMEDKPEAYISSTRIRLGEF